jgi:hypothetical protein
MVEAVVTTDRFTLNDVALNDAFPVSTLVELLGPATRIETMGKPAPAGHRNNQIHFYDKLGIFFIEHHFTYLIKEACFVFSVEGALIATKSPFCGRLKVGDVTVSSKSEAELLQTGFPFVQKLPGVWSYQGSITYVGFDVDQSSTERFVTSVSVCLHQNPRDTTHRPRPNIR